MRSSMIETADYLENEEKENYSELQVMHSCNGYYIGTMFHNPEGYDEPGSRDSEYFKSFKEANDFLKELENNSKEALNKLRTHP